MLTVEREQVVLRPNQLTRVPNDDVLPTGGGTLLDEDVAVR